MQKVPEETISDLQPANNNNSLSNIQNLINHLSFKDVSATAELFINFDSNILTSIKMKRENEEEDCVRKDELRIEVTDEISKA